MAAKRKTKRASSTAPAASRRVSTARRASGVAKKQVSKRLPEFQPPPNDNLSNGFAKLGLVPERYRGTDKFLDVVTWNIRFFHDRDPDRVKRIVNVLTELNADIIVLQEILDQSLEVVARELAHREAGYYETAYGTTGGNQRVAMMYDLDWVRAKDDIRELYQKGAIITSEGKDVFPRLPLLGEFTALTEENPFDFQLVGLHLKSQRGGGEEQRKRAAQELSHWLVNDAPKIDADVIMLGDWNQPPSAAAWEPIRRLEATKKLLFTGINSESEISHLMYRNKQEIGSKLDLAAISMSASEKMGKPPAGVRWEPLEDLLANTPSAQQIKEFIKTVREEVSDHLPVVTRFYFTDAA